MVVIQSKVNRGIAKNIVIGFIPDLVIAWIVSAWMGGEFVEFVLAFAALQCIYLLIWLRRFIWGWLVFWMVGRRTMTEHLETFLLQNRFPRPPKYVSDITEYLGAVANDRQEGAKVRVAAATELGTFEGIKLAGKYSLGLMLFMAYEDALQKYAKRFPPKPEAKRPLRGFPPLIEP